jgi:hypothetical protein
MAPNLQSQQQFASLPFAIVVYGLYICIGLVIFFLIKTLRYAITLFKRVVRAFEGSL